LVHTHNAGRVNKFAIAAVTVVVTLVVLRYDTNDLAAEIVAEGYTLGTAPVFSTPLYASSAGCAADILAAFPDIPKQWMPKGTFGGRETDDYVGQLKSSGTFPRIPDLNMMDGPQGVRDRLSGKRLANRTSWPAASTVGMAWSHALAHEVGVLAAADWHAVGANVALLPGVNIHRVPINGRNWEYISGEEGKLGTLAVPLVRGLQSTGMMASLKHFAINNQELEREKVIALIDEATLHQSYLRAFQAVVDVGVGSVMCTYSQVEFGDPNRVEHPAERSHAYTCASQKLLKEILREEMGFKGAVMTDWSAKMTNTTYGSDGLVEVKLVRDYIEWEMAWGYDISAHVPAAKEAREEIVRNSLTGMLVSGILPNTTGLLPPTVLCNAAAARVSGPATLPQYKDNLPLAYTQARGNTEAIAQALIAESMVLLKNDKGLLPLRPKTKILLAGTALLNGGGSGDSAAFGYNQPNHKGEGVHTGGKYAQEVMVETLRRVFDEVDWDHSATAPWESYDVVLAFGGQFRSEAYLVKQKDGFYHIDQCSSENITGVVARAGGGGGASEGGGAVQLYGDCDFAGEFLPSFQHARKQGTKVLAVTTTGGVHYPDYMHLVDATITLMYPGQHFAGALARVLVGEISPGGKLSYTLPTLEDDGLHIQSPVGRFNAGLQYDRTKGAPRPTLHPPAYLWDPVHNRTTTVVQYSGNVSAYAEKRLIGYKYYEKHGMVPMFPFGFGLSYFKYMLEPDFSQCHTTTTCTIGVDVSCPGGECYQGIASEVLQVYVGFEAEVEESERPVKELQAFLKVWAPGRYHIEVDADEQEIHDRGFFEWNMATRSWISPCKLHPKGAFVVHLGTSVRDILGTTRLLC